MREATGSQPRRPRDDASALSRRRAAADGLHRVLMSVAARLPLGTGYAVARLLGRRRYRRLPRSKWLTDGVGRLLDVDRDRLESWAERACELGVSDELDLFRFERLRPGEAGRLMEVQGLERLDEALAGGKGAILFSAHAGGLHLLLARLGELGYAPTFVGYSPTGWWGSSRNVEIRERRIRRLEQAFDCRFFFMDPDNFGVAVKAAAALRSNGVVVMLVDLPHPKTAVEVDLFAGRTLFSVGPILIAQASAAPLLDFYVQRDDRWVPQLAEIGAPFFASADRDETARACAAKLEEAMRRRPPPPARYFSSDLWKLVVGEG